MVVHVLVAYDDYWLVMEQKDSIEEGSGIFIMLFVVII